MEDLMDAIRRILANWTATKIPITADIHPGDSVITVRNTQRFTDGDEIIIWDGRNGKGEVLHYVTSVLSNTQLQITPPARFEWLVDNQVLIKKCFNTQLIQRIYVGDPDNIPKLPAITVNPTNKQSSWLTIDSTKEVFNLKITAYTEDAQQEEAFRMLMRIIRSAEKGLKNNICPLVTPYETTTLLSDIEAGDRFIKVADTSLFVKNSRIFIEDTFQDDEVGVKRVVDSTTLELYQPTCAFSKADTVIINVHRHIFNSWPETVNFGDIYKGTMLKAASINWFGWEEEVHFRPIGDRHLS
jgi:hypothetical protein